MKLRRPGHTTVIAYLALFIALSGTALAAKKIGPSGLQKNAVTTKKIATGAVTTPKLANDAVTTAKLDNGSVSEGKLGNDSVTGGKLAAQSVGTNKLKDDAVDSAKLANGAVVEAKIGNDAVNGSKIAPGSVGLDDIADVVAPISFDPGVIAGGACAVSPDIPVAGMQATDALLVIPLGTGVGWTADFQLSAYGASGAATIKVEVCNQGAAVDPPALPMLALAFR
jgi:hypothetical protein